HPYAIFEKGECTVFIIEIGYPMGGYTAAFGLLSFLDESMNQAEIIGQTTLTNEGGRQSTINFINDTLLEVKSEELEFDEITDEENVINTRYNYYIITGEGFYKVEKGRISGARLFPQASSRIFEVSELKNYQNADLDIMRNEIFADHGYIFKTEKWKHYFDKQHWYSPLYNDVTDELTIIEKINIDNILIVSKEKR
ncbi:MAG: YARHG domain-containing protein, partial [bacterium]